MAVIYTQGIDLYYEISGAGDPLVLIAGLGYDHWMWHKMVPFFARDFQVIAFDNRGVGQSGKTPGPYTAQMLAADTAGLIEGLGLRKAHIMGHSMGGFIAQALALSRPDLVDKLVLSATNFGGPRAVPPTPAAMAILTDVTAPPVERFTRGLAVSCAPGFAETHPEIIQDWMDYRTRAPIDPPYYQAQLAIGLGLLKESEAFESRLKEVQAPTLILFGEADQVVPPANGALLEKVLPHSEFVQLPNAGHFFPMEKPEEAVAIVTKFLKNSANQNSPTQLN